jgi:hypothetical protein
MAACAIPKYQVRKGMQALAPRVRPRRYAWWQFRLTRVQRPAGSASNTFLFRALSRVVLPGVPLMTTEKTQEPTHRIPPKSVGLKVRQAAHYDVSGSNNSWHACPITKY